MPRLSDDPTDDAGLYVLGLLEPEERAAMTERLGRQPGLRDAVAAWTERLMPLHEAAPPLAPPAAAWAGIQARLGHQPATRRRQDGVWVTLALGVQMRMLQVAPVGGTRSAMLRMTAGSELPPHEHDELEECFVIDGSIRIGDEDFSAGDHLVAGAGSTHQRIVAHTPATLLLHWSAAD